MFLSLVGGSGEPNGIVSELDQVRVGPGSGGLKVDGSVDGSTICLCSDIDMLPWKQESDPSGIKSGWDQARQGWKKMEV